MAENQNSKTSSQDLQSQRGAQNQPTAGSSRSGSGSVARRSFHPFMVSPWEFLTGNPFSLMRRMSEEMDNFFNQARSGPGRESGAVWSPAIEVAERDGKYMIHAELPGLKPEEVKVEVRDNALVIEGERRSEHEENRGGIHRSERRYGQFYREIPLPEGVNPDQINARFENGMLEITAPVPQARSNSRQIPIQSTGGQSAGSQASSGQSGGTTQSGGGQQSMRPEIQSIVPAGAAGTITSSESGSRK
jgi:HSP20 family protein